LFSFNEAWSEFPKRKPGSKQNHQAHPLVETPMATDERLHGAGWWPTKRSSSLQDYSGTAECAGCHAEKTSTQRGTPMANAAAAALDADILRKNAVMTLQAGRYQYSISRDSGRSQLSVSDGVAKISEPILWAFGIGKKGQTYLYKQDGFFYESRMSFYTSTQNLDLTTGHGKEEPDTLEDALGRRIDPETLQRCFGCHTTAATTTAGFDPSHLTPGVTCEACHGPGAAHVFLMRTEQHVEGEFEIFNPRRLSPIALNDFCGACHRTWNDVYEMGTTGVANVRFQPYRLENSRCWGEGDARLTCIACHDPHQPLNLNLGSYDAKCLACHLKSKREKAEGHPGKACPVARKNCVSCHMPRVVVPNMHAPFTDHRIRIVKRGAPYPD
jgi:cytochrome c554/c'-like protein